MAGDAAEPGPFRWPPKPLPGEPGERAPEGHAGLPDPSGEPSGVVSAAERPLGLIETLERVWLGRSVRRARDRVSFDEVGAPSACWRCAGSVGAGEADESGCAACRGRRLAWERAFRLGPYEGELQAAVHDLKYHAYRSVGRELGAGLGGRIRGAIGSELKVGKACVVPVPTALLRRCSRNGGVDHTLTLSRAVAGVLGVPVRRLLARRPGPSQTGLSASARQKNVRNMFAWRGRAGGLGPAETVIVVDDVRTTGATLTACIRAMRGRRTAEAREPGGVEPRFIAATVAVATPRRARATGLAGVESGGAGDKREN